MSKRVKLLLARKFVRRYVQAFMVVPIWVNTKRGPFVLWRRTKRFARKIVYLPR